MIPHTQKHGVRYQNQVSSITTSEVINLRLEVVLDLLQPLHPILDIQVNLRVLKIIPNDSPYPKTWVGHQNQDSSIVTTKVRNLHLEVVLDLLQHLHPILDLQVNLGLLKKLAHTISYLEPKFELSRTKTSQDMVSPAQTPS